jgi:large subunit ribosomal protein L10
MRAEKKFITKEYLERLNASPFFIVVDYQGLSVGHFAELRKRLRKAGAEVHVVKNSIFRAAAKEAGIEDLGGALAGQLAVVTGQQDISAAAKAVKTFQAEFDRPKLQFGYLDNDRLDLETLNTLADLPPLDVLRGTLLGTLQAPAQKLARLLSTPATQLAQVLKARQEQQEQEKPAAA